jgi:hypothetical protein
MGFAIGQPRAVEVDGARITEHTVGSPEPARTER